MIRNFEEITYTLTAEEKGLMQILVDAFLAKVDKGQVGKKHAVKNADIQRALKEKLGVKVPPARIRHLITAIRCSDLVENLCSTSNGYFIAENAEEFKSTIYSLQDRLISQESTLVALKKQYRRNFGPLLEEIDLDSLDLKPLDDEYDVQGTALF